MGKKILVCGDSFNYNDPDYGDLHWTQKLKKMLPDAEIINLSTPGCSNFLIHVQIDRAIGLQPDCVIVSFTNCLRGDFKLKMPRKTNNLLDRFFKFGTDNKNADLLSFTYSGVDYVDKVDSARTRIIKEYVVECIDLDVERLRNYYIISNALSTLAEQNINFLYSTGGFDHSAFMNNNEIGYKFQKFSSHEIPVNLWDHYERQNKIRPYFHNINNETHLKMAEFCKSKIV
jgi:hypothetical protein